MNMNLAPSTYTLSTLSFWSEYAQWECSPGKYSPREYTLGDYVPRKRSPRYLHKVESITGASSL